jgi:hypothetical protein
MNQEISFYFMCHNWNDEKQGVRSEKGASTIKQERENI